MAAYILLIDPYPARRNYLRQSLALTGHQVRVLESSDAGLRRALSDPPLLIVADIAFEEPVALCRLRERYRVPLILVSSRQSTEDEIVGLSMGADDVITRPENESLLLARVSAVLRRAGPLTMAVEKEEAGDPLAIGEMIIDPASRMVTVGGRPVDLSPREFLLLYTLASEAGAVVSREELLERVWGPDFAGEMQTVYVYMSWLRKKLEVNAPESHRIVTVHGVGYKLVAEEAA